jgi:chromosome segregation ATPase
MGLHAIEAAPKDGSQKDTGGMTATHWAVGQRLFQRQGRSIAFCPTHWLPRSKTVPDSCGTSRVAARASVTVGACVLWLLIGAVRDNALCGESNTRARAFVAPTEREREIVQPNTMRGETSLVSRVVETTVVAQKKILERSRAKNDILADRLTPIQGSDAAQGKTEQAPQTIPAWERTQALDYAEALARALTLTSSLQAELDALRSEAEAARIKQRLALDQERGRAETLARQLTSLRAELDSARIGGSEAVQAAGAASKQKQVVEEELKRERDRAEALARELTSLRAELDAARTGGSEAVQAAGAAGKQKQVVEEELKRERDRAEALARELTSLRAELDAARTGGSEAVQAAKTESKQKQAVEQELKQERDRAEALARELTSLRAELDAARTGGSEAVQAAKTESKQKQAVEHALKQERDRVDILARELSSLRVELDRARTAGPEVMQVATAVVAQRQALERERGRARLPGRELTSLAAELDAARAQGGEASRTAEAANIEQDLAIRKERDKTETLTRELASAQKKAEEHSARLAAACAEVLRTTETNSRLVIQIVGDRLAPR